MNKGVPYTQKMTATSLSRRDFSKKLLVAGTALFMGMNGGCKRRESKAVLAAREGRLLLGNGVEPQSLDPHISTGVSELNIHFALLEGLVRFDSRDLSPLPGIAERWEVSEDKLVWRFYLRKNARWSNGDLVTGTDFLFAWQRILSPNVGSPNAYLLYGVKGAEAYNKGTISDFAETGFSCPDPLVVTVRLNKPLPYFLSLLMHPAWLPLHPASVLAEGPASERLSGWSRPGKYISNGPFMLTEHLVNERIAVSANPHYYAREQVSLKEIHFLPVADKNAEETLFLAEQLHITYSLPPAKAPTYQSSNDPRLRLSPYLGTEYYMVNTRTGPLSDQRVRKALSLSIDRDLIAHRVLAGGQQPAYSFVPPGCGGYNDPAKIRENTDEARRLLAAAGFPNGANLPTLEILFNNTESNRKVAESIQFFWQSNLGIQAQLIGQEYGAYKNNRQNGSFQLARSSWIGDFPDPVAFLSLWQSDSGNNFSGWSSKDYDRLLENAAASPGPSERLALLKTAEERLLEASPLIPIYHNVFAHLVHPDIQGWHQNLLGWHDYRVIRFSPAI